jgi:hypothetical protein
LNLAMRSTSALTASSAYSSSKLPPAMCVSTQLRGRNRPPRSPVAALWSPL